MAADIVAFAQGHSKFSDLSEYSGEQSTDPKTPAPSSRTTIPLTAKSQLKPSSEKERGKRERGPSNRKVEQEPQLIERPELVTDKDAQRIVTVVCPSRELSYPISLVGELGVDTVTADFGQFNNKDVLKSAAKWIDLSDSETIWRE